MSTVFDTTFLPGGEFLASQDDFLDFDATFQPTNYAAASTMTPNDGTVSPSDLFKDDFVMSAPPSTAFPNLSTPESGYLESPAMASSGLNTSPLEDGLLDGQLNFAELDNMAPLFPQNGFDQFAQKPMPTEPSRVNSSFSAGDLPFSASESPMVRQKSSPGRPSVAFAHGRKHSETHGISKSSAKSRKTLAEIKIDSDDDKETAKRKKNTAAARKSRQRKQEAAEAADAEIQRLRAIIYRLGADPDAES